MANQTNTARHFREDRPAPEEKPHPPEYGSSWKSRVRERCLETALEECRSLLGAPQTPVPGSCNAIPLRPR